MRTIRNMVIAITMLLYFILRVRHELGRINVPIIFYAAKYKLKCCNISIEHKTKAKYRQNKNRILAVESSAKPYMMTF